MQAWARDGVRISMGCGGWPSEQLVIWESTRIGFDAIFFNNQHSKTLALHSFLCTIRQCTLWHFFEQ